MTCAVGIRQSASHRSGDDDEGHTVRDSDPDDPANISVLLAFE